MAGKNLGKKYVKLRGGEVATPENEARARDFLTWYGDNAARIRKKLIFDHLYDDEVATDTMLAVYDTIALKGLRVDNYQFYYLRAYHTNRLAALKRTAAHETDSIDAPRIDGRTIADTLAAPQFDYDAYERAVDQLQSEITEYVREAYDPAACSIYEIYMGLQPDFTYTALAEMLGMKFRRVRSVVIEIKADVAGRFDVRKDFLLSLA